MRTMVWEWAGRGAMVIALALVGGCGDSDPGASEVSAGSESEGSTSSDGGTAGPTTDGTGDPLTGGSDSETSAGPEPACGDGVVDAGEECDEGESNADSAACKADCTNNVCGDGALGPDEACDDGENNGADAACKDDCTANSCGDGAQGPGEECDDGENNDDAGTCKSDCTLATCGDGLVGPGEGCDDGNQVDDDECTNECKLASCGDGVVAEGEACDDGNDDNTDECTDACTLAACGDGFAQESNGEGCDAGVENDDNGDCTSACQVASCGDGLLHNVGQGVEECDDGNEVDDDACSSLCIAATCEDGAQNDAESDIDCGGEVCAPCELGQSCKADDDCVGVNKCQDGLCELAVSCAEILQIEPDASSGQYTIDVDGQGPEAPMTVQCDMETDEGGWTLIGSQINGDGRSWNSLESMTDANGFGALDTYQSADYKSPGWGIVPAQHLMVRTEEYAVAWTIDLLGGVSFGDWISSEYNMQACTTEFVGGTPQFVENLSDQQQLIFDIVVRPLDSNCSCFPGCNENTLIGFVFPQCCWTYGLGNTPAGQGTWSGHDHSMPKISSLTRQVCNGGFPCNPSGSINAGATCYNTSCKTSMASVWVR